MKTLSSGDKLAFLSQHVLHFHVLDDYTKKNFTKQSVQLGNLGEEHCLVLEVNRTS